MDQAVHWSPELDRILKLPRRKLEEVDMQQLSNDLSGLLLTERGRANNCKLKPIQALALEEAFQVRGLFGGLVVGAGKTLMTWLLPTVLESKRPLLMIPADLREKTLYEFGLLARDWVSPKYPIRDISYELMTRITHADFLDRFKPDLIMLDEMDLARNTEKSVAKRVGRYLRSSRKAGKHVIFCGLTGTPIAKSLKDIAHFLDWALGDRSPYPRTYPDLEAWCGALDQDTSFLKKKKVGVLINLVRDETGDDVERCRMALRKRLVETAGVVMLDGSSCDQPLSIRFVVPPPDLLLDEAFRKFRRLKETPDGWPLSDPLSFYRHTHELACGFYYYWDPRPPREWIEARRAWCAHVRDTIQHSRAPVCDTELTVARAYPEAEELLWWRSVKDSFVPETHSKWLTGSVLGAAKNWLAENDPAVVWVAHRAVGKALAKLCGLSYYAEGGLDQNGTSVVHAKSDRSMICSLPKKGARGRNMQGWNKALLFSPMQSAQLWEQWLGRHHRTNQDRPVQIDVMLSCIENYRAVMTAHARAGWIKATGGQTHKLLSATFEEIPTLIESPRYVD